MAADRDPQETAVEMLRAVASSGFGIINAIQAQSAAVDDLVSMAKRNTHISADEVQNTLDLLQLAKDELANAYDLALEATIATWSVTEVPGGVYLPNPEPADPRPNRESAATASGPDQGGDITPDPDTNPTPEATSTPNSGVTSTPDQGGSASGTSALGGFAPDAHDSDPVPGDTDQ